MMNINRAGASRADRSDRFWSAERFARVQTAKRERARRTMFLPSELFAEPAWDILVELYAFELVSRVVTESEIADRISVPIKTAARWMKMLEAHNLIDRRVDPDDGDQIQVALTCRALEALDGYFSDANR